MERTILKTLDFDISVPTALHFLRRFSKAARSDYKTHTLSKFLTELAHIDLAMMKYLPSKIAASAVFIARYMLNETPTWVRFAFVVHDSLIPAHNT